MDDLFSPLGLSGRTLTRSDLAPLTGGAPQVVTDCDLEEADLSGLDLTGWRFERCNLRKTDCSDTKLEGSVWQSCRAPFVSFVGANLSEATFSGGDFNNSVRRATLTSTKFVGTKLTGADFSEARAMHIHFEEVLLVSAKLPGFSFRKETLRRVDLSGADVRKVDFRMTVFEDCSLREAMVAGSRFEGSDLRGADLGGLRLVDANLFRGATISREQAGQLLGELGLTVR
jgi:fluoroquinolone resistance protein